MSRDTTTYLDRHSSADQPPSLTLYSTAGRLLQVLAENRLDAQHPYAPYLDTRPRHRFGTLQAEDGQALEYELIEPPRLDPARRYPVVIEVYGGPGLQFVADRWGEQAAYFEQLLTERGFLVFKLDNRGSGERGTRFESLLYHRLGTIEVRDQLRGLEYLRTLEVVDPARIGVFGWSYGGYLALRCLLEAPERFAAGVAGAPVTDWRRYDTHYTERYLGTPQENPDAYERSSVLAAAGNLQRPLLLLHGMADDNVRFTHSTALMQRLQDLGKPFQLMTYPGAKHGLLQQPDTGPHAYATILRFLDAELGGGRFAVAEDCREK
jgi:dipeptidyl-peptidase-4